ncbi:MAG: PASTA domain-containing protein [Oscillospiraceae bacterium]
MSGKVKQIIIIAVILAALAAAACIFVFSGSKEDGEAKLLAAAENYYKALDYDKAIATYNRIISENSSCAEAYIGLADVYIDMGNEAKASEILERGINEAKSANSVADKFKDIFGDESYAELFSSGADVSEENVLPPEESEELTEDIPDETEPAVTEIPDEEEEEAESAETEVTTVPTETETAAPTTAATTAAPVVYTTAATRAATYTTTLATTTTLETTTTTTAATTVPTTVTTAETTTTTVSYKLNLYAPESLTIKVPNFIGQREDYVTEVAASKGITLECIYEYNEEYAAGRVFQQSFSNGEKIAPSMIMYVHVSLGSKNAQTEAPVVTTAATTFKSEIKLINFKGMSIKDAQTWCKQNGLLLDVTDEGEEGGAIKKQSPAFGVKVTPGTTIYVVN